MHNHANTHTAYIHTPHAHINHHEHIYTLTHNTYPNSGFFLFPVLREHLEATGSALLGVCMYTCVYVCMSMLVSACVCVCMSVCECVCMSVRTCLIGSIHYVLWKLTRSAFHFIRPHFLFNGTLVEVLPGHSGGVCVCACVCACIFKERGICESKHCR